MNPFSLSEGGSKISVWKYCILTLRVHPLVFVDEANGANAVGTVHWCSWWCVGFFVVAHVAAVVAWVQFVVSVSVSFVFFSKVLFLVMLFGLIFPHKKHIVLSGKANVEVKMRVEATSAERGEWPLSLRYGPHSRRRELDGDLIRALKLVRYGKRICRTKKKEAETQSPTSMK